MNWINLLIIGIEKISQKKFKHTMLYDFAEIEVSQERSSTKCYKSRVPHSEITK